MTQDAVDLDKIKKTMLRKYPAFAATICNVKYQIVDNSHPIKTAATDGKTIYVNADYMASLSAYEQVFVMAHEVCHIALKHVERGKGKEQKLWGMATDAVINQHLKQDGLPLPQGARDMPDALQYNAEDLYQIFSAKQQQNLLGDQNGCSMQQEDSSLEQMQGGISVLNNIAEYSDHSLWEMAVDMQSVPGRQQQDDQSDNSQTNSQSTLLGGQNQNDGQENDPTPYNSEGLTDYNVDKSVFGKAIEIQAKQMQQDQRVSQKQPQESQELVIKEDQIFEKNALEKVRRAEEVMSMLNAARRGLGGQSEMVDLAQIGAATQPVTNWKRVLKSALEEEDEIWGHRFSDKRSGYVARIQDVEYDESREIEIILDTSGSVSMDLCKNFLRQVKTILKDSELKVDTFSDEFHGFVKIEKGSDFDELKLSVGGGTNFDAASRAFPKSKDVNRICFTDGQDYGGAGIRDKRSDIIWISYGNSSFKPDNGKVLYVPVSEINAVQKKHEPEMSR